MEANDLQDGRPEIILQEISRTKDGSIDYFYNEEVSNLNDRRKLKKRFDNIINISIKKEKCLQAPDNSFESKD